MQRRSLLLSALVLSLGCGGGAPEGSIVEGIVPVSGTATYQGKPLEDYSIFFSDGENRPATDIVDGQGHFALSTNSEGDGAPAGTHKVWFSYSPVIDLPPGREQPDTPVPQPKVKLPGKYMSMQSTDLSVEVPEDGLTDYKLELE